MKNNVLVLGAGVQGSCIALELAKRGFSVDLIDQDSIPMNRTSIRNEGKIHLGLVYMNDPGFSTPELMLKASLRFSRYLSRWIEASIVNLNISTPFYYLVSNESFLSADQLQERYAVLQEMYEREKRDDPDLDYLGQVPQTLAKKSKENEFASFFNPDELQGVFQTPELAIDTGKLAENIRRAIELHPNITFRGERKILSISKNGSSFVVEGEKGEQDHCRMEALQVVNATWTNKFMLDQSVGIEPPAGILHRLKYRMIADIHPDKTHYPSATMVIGRFGDVVIRPDATAYVSWYPDACQGWSNTVQPPESWEEVCRGIISKEEFETFAHQFITQTQQWYPMIKNCTPKVVDAGVIVAFGESDVDDENSRLHGRSQLGVTSFGGYHSVFTGKLTAAPLTAMDTADHVEEVFHQQ